MNNKEKRPIGKILMILAVVFFYLPILYMIIFSFNDGKSLTSFTGFSLRWYKHMLDSSDMMDALSTTFSIALLATFISTVTGTIAAIGISKSKKIVRDLMEQINNLPIMNPEIVTAIGFMLLFITFHVEKGYVTMLLAHIAFCIPYVMLSVMQRSIAGSEPCRCGNGSGGNTVAGTDESCCAADHAGNRSRCIDRIYHVSG